MYCRTSLNKSTASFFSCLSRVRIIGCLIGSWEGGREGGREGEWDREREKGRESGEKEEPEEGMGREEKWEG